MIMRPPGRDITLPLVVIFVCLTIIQPLCSGATPVPNCTPPPPPYQELQNTTYSGSCPIGTVATTSDNKKIITPFLRDPGYKSGSLCRGACGVDCPDFRCKKKDTINVTVKDPVEGTCSYSNVIECPTHIGCQEHDRCYDVCVEHCGEIFLGGPCHFTCDQRGYSRWGTTTVVQWVGTGGSYQDEYSPPTYGGMYLYSDPPVFVSAEKYAVFLLTNVAGGTILVGKESDLKKNSTCDYPGGGRCKKDGTDAPVQYVNKSPYFSNYDDARSSYCAEPRSNVRKVPLTHGIKADIYNGSYWIETAPEC